MSKGYLESKFPYFFMPKAGITLEAEARRSILSTLRLVLKNVIQFLRGAACSIHTVHEEGNSSGLPHFDLLTTDNLDRGSL